MTGLKIFTDGSVNPKSGVGYGAFLVVSEEEEFHDSLKRRVKVKRFEQTSSTKLELETLVWALKMIRDWEGKRLIFTDSQNITGLHKRRARLEKQNYLSKKNRPIKNHDLYREFFKSTDELDCEFIKVRGHKVGHQKNHIDHLFSLVDKASRKALRHNQI